MIQPEEPIFEAEFKTFKAHLPKWLAQGIGGFALIKGDKVRGPFDTENDAVTVGYETYGNVPFLVELVVEHKTPIIINQIAA